RGAARSLARRLLCSSPPPGAHATELAVRARGGSPVAPPPGGSHPRRMIMNWGTISGSWKEVTRKGKGKWGKRSQEGLAARDGQCGQARPPGRQPPGVLRLRQGAGREGTRRLRPHPEAVSPGRGGRARPPCPVRPPGRLPRTGDRDERKEGGRMARPGNPDR